MLGFLKGFRDRKLGEPIVVVSGLPRSGTSMMMKMLDAGGIELATDQIRTADEDNPKGYFELEKVKELDKGGDRSWMREHRGKVVKVISFLLKDLPDDCRYRVIFMRRDLDEVIASQNKMLVRRGESGGDTEDAKMKQLYQGHLTRVDRWIATRPNFERLDISHRDSLAEPRATAEKVVAFIGGDLDVNAMAGVVDRQLYRNRRENLA